MRNTVNGYTKIFRCLGKYGPMTIKEIKKRTGVKSPYVRISELNCVFPDIEIGKSSGRPALYYIKFPKNIKINSNFIYPNKNLGDYSLSTKKKTTQPTKGIK